MSYHPSENKRKSKHMTEIMDRIKTIDQLHSKAPSVELHWVTILLQTEFDTLTSEHAGDLHLKSRQTHYEHGERAGKLSCHQLKQSAAASFTATIGDREGHIVTDQQGINQNNPILKAT